jgi:DNA-binding NarL/FixJ family response regulator
VAGVIRVAIVDDHSLFGAGLESLLSRHPGFEVRWTLDSAASVLERQRSDPVEVVILDLNLGIEGSALPLIPQLVRGPDPAAVLLLSALADEDLIHAAREAGASGYVAKDVPLSELVAIVARAVDGPDEFLRWPRHVASPHPPSWGLTRREAAVLRHLNTGLTNREIAARLGVSVPTVNKQVQALYRKLGVRNRAQAVRLLATGVRPG